MAGKAPARGKWADEDAEDEDVSLNEDLRWTNRKPGCSSVLMQQDDWDVSDSEKAKPAAAPAAVAPVRKKKLKEKLAERERAAVSSSWERLETISFALIPAQKDGGDDLIDTRTEQERAREAKAEARQRELAADLDVAGDLMGSVSLEDPKETLQAILTAKPSNKEDFATLSKNIIALLTKKHESNPLYPAFVEGFVKDLCEPLSAVQVRKVGSGISTLGNAKQQEERDKASGKKKVRETLSSQFQCHDCRVGEG